MKDDCLSRMLTDNHDSEFRTTDKIVIPQFWGVESTDHIDDLGNDFYSIWPKTESEHTDAMTKENSNEQRDTRNNRRMWLPKLPTY